MEFNYSKFIELVRELFPSLKLSKIILNLEHAIEELGIQVKYSDMAHLVDGQNIDGYAYVNELHYPEIILNGERSYYRQRFTMAHELGHILMHWKWLPGDIIEEELAEISYRNKNKDSYTELQLQKENQADAFAAELLAPLNEVKNTISSCIESGILDKELQIKEIQNFYKVSNPCAYYRWLDASRLDTYE